MGTYPGSDGTGLYVEEAGAEDAPVIVLIHGWSASSDWFRPQIDALKNDYRLLVPDLRGHGRSRTGEPGATIDMLARDLDRLLTAKKVEECILLGWSMGAFIAFDYLRQFGDRKIRGLVVEDMTARILCDDNWKLGLRGTFDEAANQATLQAITANWPAMATAMMGGMFGSKGRKDESLSAWLTPLAVDNDANHLAPLWASMVQQDYRALMPTISCPALVVAGGESGTYAPEVSAWMAGQLPDARRILLDGCGHAPHVEDAAAFTGHLNDFAATVFG